MFDFEEVENKTIRQLENRISELDNQIKYWKSLYEKEIKKRPTTTKYVSTGQYYDNYYKRTKELLNIMDTTDNIQLWKVLAIDLMELYGIVKEEPEEKEEVTKEETMLEELI